MAKVSGNKNGSIGQINAAKERAVNTYTGKSPEFLDQLLAMVESTHAANQTEKSYASHASTVNLLNSASGGYGGNSKAFRTIIKECMNVYYTTPVVRNIIDLMTDFASEGIDITHQDDSVQGFFNTWAKKVNFHRFITEVFHTILLTGNCVILKQMGKISLGTQRDMTHADTTLLDSPDAKKRFIPVGYTILNPLSLDIETNPFFSEKRIYFKLTEPDIKRIKAPQTENDKLFIKSLPGEFVQQASKEGRVLLDNNRIIVLSYKKLEWQDWAYPLIFSAIDDINFKKMLRQMDESSALDVIKAVIIFKLGKMEDGLNPDKERFKKLSSLLKGVSSGKNIVWDNLLSIEDSFPPIEKILGPEKYKVVDRDILSNFGVTELLVTGASQGGFSSGFLSVRGLQEKLETVRREVLYGFVIPELEQMSKALEFTKAPSVTFSSMSFRDEVAEKKLIIDLMDRKVISPETTLKEFEYDPDIESIRMGKKKFSNILSPFDQKPIGVAGQGRPGNSKNIPQKKKRSTKPKGIGLGNIQDRVYSYVSKLYCANKNITSIGVEDKNKILILFLMALQGLKTEEYQLGLNDNRIEQAIKAAEVSIGNGDKSILHDLDPYIEEDKDGRWINYSYVEDWLLNNLEE